MSQPFFFTQILTQASLKIVTTPLIQFRMSFLSVTSAGDDSQSSQTPTEFDSTLAPSTPATDAQSFFSNSQPEQTSTHEPNPVPEGFTQRYVGGKWYVVYENKYRGDYIAWWNGTNARRNREPGKSDPKFGNPTRTARGWEAFWECAHRESGTPVLICTWCQSILVHPSTRGGGTNGMAVHLKSLACLRYRGQKRELEGSVSDMVCTRLPRGTLFGNAPDRIQLISASKKARTDGLVPHQHIPYTKEGLQDLLLKMSISMNLPFRMADNLDFRRLVSMLRPDAIGDLPHRTKLRGLLDSHFTTSHGGLFNEYVPGSKVSWAVDCWSSPDMKAYLGVLGYYVTAKWEMREVLAGFEPIHGSHDGINLANILYRVMAEHQKATHTLCITADNASNNTTMRAQLQRKIERQHGGFKWDHLVGSIPCLAHVIQLAVNKLVEGLAIESDNETTLPRFGDDHLPDQEQATMTFKCTLQKVGGRFLVTLVNDSDVFSALDPPPC